MSTNQAGGLNVIALVSGGKDSFFSLLHCRANGHRVVALANLHPAPSLPLGPPQTISPPATISVAPGASNAAAAPATVLAASSSRPSQGPDQDGTPTASVPGQGCGARGNEDEHEHEHDLNSFMYQTVGHQVIPLYAEATGIPLYRRPITGGATQHEKDYSHYELSRAKLGTASTADGHRPRRASGLPDPAGQAAQEGGGDAGAGSPDETESMVPLIETIKAAHPEANAVCAGAILSTYQRTRVESVATRLGLTPLAYLWKYPALPTSGSADPAAGPDAQLLDDMAAAGLEARIVKVASGGLDDSFLWINVASPVGKAKIARAMRRFGTAETGAVIGEGGEFETLVVDGPSTLFRKRIVVAEEDQRVVREGGGSAWLKLRNARLEDKIEHGADAGIRIPDLLDPKFASVLDDLPFTQNDASSLQRSQSTPEVSPLGSLQLPASGNLQQWVFIGSTSPSIEAETQSVVEQIRQRLQRHSLPPSAILSATVILRRMADFPTVNGIYGSLFDAPNPPSRVTVSYGDALFAAAAGAEIATCPSGRGLHVQSRSYWAPANIGPYSQAISATVASLSNASHPPGAAGSGPRLVTVAGQIPLVPATMALPDGGGGGGEGGGDALCLQIVLSLQHLWRIGVEMGVQWWTSGVVYFPRVGGEAMGLRAKLAAGAWEMAHASGRSSSAGGDGGGEEEVVVEEEDESGPDLWDRRFNPEYMSYASGEQRLPQHGGGSLPDREVLVSTSKNAVPRLFVAEVDELPRGAGVEWHAHLGVAEAEVGSVVVRDALLALGDDDGGTVAVSQAIVTGTGIGGGVSFVQTVVAERFGRHDRRGHSQLVKTALGQLGEVGPVISRDPEPAAVMVRYVDAEVLKGDGHGEELCPLVPCRSLWDAQGERLASVTVYTNVFEGSSRDA
ncbi:Diphthine--ammonia ligase [Madurella mycetomatis]|uniref:Diphthine--ammonia ligase n=1 Tax=Madurella mycetomatis TaxID=100816 RepID=A0A175VW53_9PEZI|nr:Diphthine--ammonia ligase [Madurella mycetomatis]